jgi:hypothetical protein
MPFKWKSVGALFAAPLIFLGVTSVSGGSDVGGAPLGRALKGASRTSAMTLATSWALSSASLGGTRTLKASSDPPSDA